MKFKRRGLTAAFTAAMLMIVSALTVSATIPNDSYTYWEDVGSEGKSVYSKAMYGVKKVLSADDLGVDAFESVKNISTDKNGNLYILDSDSRIIVLDKNYRVINEIGAIEETERYDNAESVYVSDDGTVYICDTVGKRIIHATAQGELIEIIEKPESNLIPDDFNFTPTDIVIDSYGYLYVVSDGSYFGALLYSPEKAFLGFYGANYVKTSVATVIGNIMNRVFPSNEKKANSVKKLPYCFVDIAIDNEGFIYTCNGYTDDSDRTGQIRRLSPGNGTDILNSSSVNFVDERISNTKYKGFYRQNITGIAVDENGFVYALESTYGKIFVYDSLNRCLTSFAGGMGEGTQKGTFTAASGIAVTEDGDVVVCDSSTNLLTVFGINDYGKSIKKLITLTNSGEYEKAEPGWQEVLKLDSNFQPAYSGLARAAISREDYKTAMKYAEIGYDRDSYAVAFQSERADFLNRNFVLLFIVASAAIISVLAFIVVTTKRNPVLIKNREVLLMLASPFHPSNSFSDVKEKGYGSISLCTFLVVLFYIVTVLQTLAGGFMFTVYDNAAFNSIWVLARTVGLVVLWIIANWMVCTLLGGNGRLKEIAIVTCYSLIPLILERFLRLILTNILIPAEADFLTVFDAVAVIWFLLIMITGLIRIHDFSFGRLIGTSVLTVFGIAAIAFLMIMIFILAQQFYGFISTVVSELFMI